MFFVLKNVLNEISYARLKYQLKKLYEIPNFSKKAICI